MPTERLERPARRRGEDLMPKKHGNIPLSRSRAYEKLKRRYGKRIAAKIAWAGRTRAGRSRMARKAARTRRLRGR